MNRADLDNPQEIAMGKVQDIKEKFKKLLASPVYSTIVLVPLLIVVILVSAAVFMAAENTGNADAGNWRYYDAVYYIVTLVTTIGYGNYTPKTNGGKILTIFYIVLFVPLAMLTIAKTSQCLTLGTKYLWIAFCRCLGKKNVSREVENVSLPLLIPVKILLIYILIGSAIFLVLEKDQKELLYFDMLYLVFVSLSTIGFGDICPLNEDGFTFFVIYTFGGLMLVAMCINVGWFDDVNVNDEKDQKNDNDKTIQKEEKVEEAIDAL